VVFGNPTEVQEISVVQKDKFWNGGMETVRGWRGDY